MQSIGIHELHILGSSNERLGKLTTGDRVGWAVSEQSPASLLFVFFSAEESLDDRSESIDDVLAIFEQWRVEGVSNLSLRL